MKYDLSNIYEFEWTELLFRELEIDICIDALKTLIINQEKSLIETQEKIKDFIQNDSTYNSLPVQVQSDYFEHIFGNTKIINDEIQNIQRYSSCLMFYSIFEGQLGSICKKIEDTFSFKIKISDLNGSDNLLRYWTYLNKVFEIDTTKVECFYTCIKQQKSVRNLIAHENGLFSENKKSKYVKVTGIDFIKRGEEFQLKISTIDYLDYLISKMRGFFLELLLSIDKRYKEIRNTN